MTGTALHGGWAAPEPQAAGGVRWMESSRAYVVPLGPAGVGDRQEGHELRIALAMKGGVSLAVWIGGAVTELDLLRRAMQPDDVHPEQPPAGLSRDEWGRALAYRERVLALGYTSVKIDVLAGASAGGLNAAIYGFAQSVGLSLNWMLRVWERNGDIME
ncbi:MAG: patatin-like phospholipase family protein, partial [Ruaniaceae bacterium]|nr:patatin-like phospholipase family protein [Ruaniaceae bacterium]